MNVLFVASEMVPFAKTGGLGDVIGSLPKVLRQHGIDARVVMPHYSTVRDDTVDYLYSYQVQRSQGDGEVTVHTTVHDGVPVYFLRSWPYFTDDGKIYTVWDWDTPRFIYFAQMTMSFIWELANGRNGAEPYWPDVVHVHDWHTGLVPYLLHLARFNPGWQDVASVMTIHNMGFQGPYAGQWLDAEALPYREHPALHNDYLRDNMLGIGIAYADKVNTVSPRHALELHYERFGEGLQDVVWGRDADFSGILNGIDIDFFDPGKDPHLAQMYDVDDFREKRVENKLELQRRQYLEVDPDIPIISFVSRLTNQKGMDYAIPALREIMATTDAQFVGIGTGDPVLEAQFGQVGLEFSWKARTYLMHNFDFAKQIYAGADLLLVPSRYEPCGLAQMIAMRYGCLPLVRETGGLADTVTNFDGEDGGTGFVFLFEEADALVNTVRWALDVFKNQREAWQAMQERGMRHNWSWDASIPDYVALYEGAMAKKRAWRNP